MPDQARLVKAGFALALACTRRRINAVLYALPAHNLHDLPRSLLVQAGPGILVPHVRLQVKVGGRHARADLLREGREGAVVVECGEELEDAFGDVREERCAVSEGDCSEVD